MPPKSSRFLPAPSRILCKCGKFVANNALAISHHEQGNTHKRALSDKLRNESRNSRESERESARSLNAVAEAAQRAGVALPDNVLLARRQAQEEYLKRRRLNKHIDILPKGPDAPRVIGGATELVAGTAYSDDEQSATTARRLTPEDKARLAAEETEKMRRALKNGTYNPFGTWIDEGASVSTTTSDAESAAQTQREQEREKVQQDHRQLLPADTHSVSKEHVQAVLDDVDSAEAGSNAVAETTHAGLKHSAATATEPLSVSEAVVATKRTSDVLSDDDSSDGDGTTARRSAKPVVFKRRRRGGSGT